jgi:hypothetical protein
MSAAPYIRIAVGIPVRNEQRLLPGLLAALAGQRGIDPDAVGIAFLLDGCTDGSEALVRGWQAPFAVTVRSGPADRPCAGRARRAVMEEAVRTGAALLLCTDADSAPEPGWIAAAVRALALADVVAGRIRRIGDVDRAQDALEAYYDRLHGHRRAVDPVGWDPAPGHHHTGGANLGFRAEAYRALGGFDPVPSGEDALILDRAHRLGLRVRRDAAMVVATSSRRRGRAPGGLAAALARQDRGVEARVAHPADASWQYRCQALARGGFARLPGSAAGLAARFGLPVDEVLAVAGECANAEAFAMRIAPPVPGGPRLVSLAEASAALDALESPNDRTVPDALRAEPRDVAAA